MFVTDFTEISKGGENCWTAAANEGKTIWHTKFSRQPNKKNWTSFLKCNVPNSFIAIANIDYNCQKIHTHGKSIIIIISWKIWKNIVGASRVM